MKNKTIFNVPAAVSEISSGFILTMIDEIEAKLHIVVDDIAILYLKSICSYEILFDHNKILIEVYSSRFTVHTKDVISELYFDHISVRDGWISETNKTDDVYLFFAHLDKDDFSCIGCLTKQVIDTVYEGCLEKTVMHIMKSY